MSSDALISNLRQSIDELKDEVTERDSRIKELENTLSHINLINEKAQQIIIDKYETDLAVKINGNKLLQSQLNNSRNSVKMLNARVDEMQKSESVCEYAKIVRDRDQLERDRDNERRRYKSLVKKIKEICLANEYD